MYQQVLIVRDHRTYLHGCRRYIRVSLLMYSTVHYP